MNQCIVVLFILIRFMIASLYGDSSVTTLVDIPVEQWQQINDKVIVKGDNVQLLLITQHDANQKQKLKQAVDEVSDPNSVHYGQYKTYDEIYKSILSQTTINGDTLERWAQQNGIKVTKATNFKEFIMIEAPIFTIEKAFRTELNLYQHIKTGQTVLRGTSFTLSSYIHHRIAFISGLMDFPMIRDNKAEHNIGKTSSNAPIIQRLDSGFSKYLFYIQLVCSNGESASNSLCGNQFNGYEITISKVSKPFQVSVDQTNCEICSKATPLIASFCVTFSLTKTAVLCRFYLNQENSIPLYQPHNFTIRTKFVNGFSDAAKYRSAVEKVIDITPPVLRSFYNVKDRSINKPDSASRQAIGGFLGEYLNMQSFRAFSRIFGEKFPLVFGKVYGSDYNNSNNDEFETSLDIQYMGSMGSRIPMDYISSPSNLDGFLIDFFFQLAFLEQSKRNIVPLVYSFSYSGIERFFGRFYINTCENQFMIHSLTGKTFFVSSGDNGASTTDGICRKPFYASYPASSAYVTSVGATQVIKATSGCQRKLNGYCVEEVVAAKSFLTGCRFTSGGGFSNFISQPNYQKAAVANYLKLATTQLPPETYFNRHLRAYPDVSLVGHQYQFKLFGNYDLFADGTSASSPALAGLISLVVNQRLKMGKKPLGLLNPLLYSIGNKYPAAFYDVTKGDIKCNKSPTCCKYGFVAEKKWDPTTGWGSINHEILMQKLIMA